MDKWGFLRQIQRDFAFDLETEKDRAVLINRLTGGCINVYEEEYYTDEQKVETFVRYTVEFSTQHRHFQDLDDVEEYICLILTDEILPIEFCYHGERRFGGEVRRDDLEGLTAEWLADQFGYTADYIKQFDYEIHSWSGKYDTTLQQRN